MLDPAKRYGGMPILTQGIGFVPLAGNPDSLLVFITSFF